MKKWKIKDLLLLDDNFNEKDLNKVLSELINTIGEIIPSQIIISDYIFVLEGKSQKYLILHKGKRIGKLILGK